MTTSPPAGSITIAGKTVSRLGLRTIRLTGPGTWGGPTERKTALRVLQDAVWAAVLVLVEHDRILLNDTSGQGHLVLPGAHPKEGKPPAIAARNALKGFPNGLPIDRLPTTDHVQTRRRLIVVHTYATEVPAEDLAIRLVPQDGRSDPRLLPLAEVVSSLPQHAISALKVLADKTQARR